MEIPLMIETGITRFQSPNLLFHLRTLSTWLALIVAAVATFNSIVRRSKRLILTFRRGRSVISPPPPRTFYNDSDDDVSCSSSSSDDDEAGAPEEDLEDEIRGQNGNCEQHFEWPELGGDGGSVVKLWDGLGLRFDRSEGLISLLDSSREEALRSVLWAADEIPAAHVASPQTFVLSGDGRLKVWDSRAAAVAASHTWQAESYMGDDVGKLTVVDLRNVRSPLAETAWWLGDGAVTAGCGGDGLVSWCLNTAWSLSGL